MPNAPGTNELNLLWIITAGTGIGLALALGFVLVILYHERSKRKSDQKYGELFDNVNDLVYIHSPKGVIQEVNKSTISLIGLSREFIIGKSISDFLPSGYKRHFRRYIDEISHTASTQEIIGIFPIARVQRIAGPRDLRLLEYRSRVVRDSSGSISSVWGVARDQTENIRQEKSLRKSHRKIQELYRESIDIRKELSTLSQKMMQMQEEDRLRISRELHDEVGQTLTAISANLEIITRDLPQNMNRLETRLEESQTLTKGVMQSVRRVVRELRPAAIDEVGLIASLEKYTSDFGARTGIKTVFQYDPVEESLTLNEKFSIYRIVQESLTNVARHSGADEAQISLFEKCLSTDDDPAAQFVTLLEIRDNGRGMNSSRIGGKPSQKGDDESPTGRKNESNPPGVGLVGIQERVKLLSGTFRMTSAPQEGVCISITLPRRMT